MDELTRSLDANAETVAPVRADPHSPWPELEPAALYGLAGDVVRAIAPHTEADPAAVLTTLLATFGVAAGREVHFDIGRDRHTLRLFVLVVGRSAKARKGTSWSEVERLIAAAVPPFASENIISGLSTGEGLIRAVRDAGEDAPAVEDKRRLIFEPEFGRVLNVGRRDGSTLLQVLRDAWDGRDLRILTRADPICATAAHLGIVAHGTLGELGRRFVVRDLGEIYGGTLNRFLVVAARSSQELPVPTRVPAREWRTLARRLRETIEWARSGDKLLEFACDGETRWREIYPELRAERGGLLDHATSRADAQCRRLVAVYAALDCSEVMRREHVDAALAVWRYADASAAVLLDGADDAPAEGETEHRRRKLVDWVKRQPAQAARARDLARTGPLEFRGRGVAEAALEDLARAGIGRWLDIPAGKTGGAPTRALTVRPFHDASGPQTCHEVLGVAEHPAKRVRGHARGATCDTTGGNSAETQVSSHVAAVAPEGPVASPNAVSVLELSDDEFAERIASLSCDARERWAERASIREADAGQERRIAERQALADVLGSDLAA